MHPIFFHIGPLTIRTYGVLVVLAFLAALQVTKQAAALRKIREDFLLDLVALLILAGLLGARLFYVLLNGSYYQQHPWETLKVWEGGLVFYGGFLLAAAAGAFFIRQRGYAVGRVADVLAPALAVGQAIGRWGCFLAGCCYGKPTPLPWAIKFKDPASLAPLGVGLHPVQLYESMGNLLLALFLWGHLMRHKDSQGEVFWLYLFLYGVLRFTVEFLRGDDRGPSLGGLFPSQVIALLAILVAGSVLLVHKTAKRDDHA